MVCTVSGVFIQTHIAVYMNVDIWSCVLTPPPGCRRAPCRCIEAWGSACAAAPERRPLEPEAGV